VEGSEWAVIDGRRIHYFDLGPRDAATVIVYIHGYAACGIDAFPVAKSLIGAGADIRLIAVDLPGAGFSERPAVSPGMPGYAAFIADWCAWLQTERVVGPPRRWTLWAHSLGAHMALRSLYWWRFTPESAAGDARSTPERESARRTAMARFDSLALLAPNGLKGEEGALASIASTELFRFLMPLYSDGLFDSISQSMVYTHPGVTASTVGLVSKAALQWNGGLDSLALLTGDTLEHDTVDGILPEIRLPTLLLWGDRDQVLAYRHARTYREMLPNCRFVALPELGHGAHVDDPDTVAALLRNFTSLHQ
jgi:pimeloyl-ACP methyl ester carboxylesterase